MQLDCLKGRVVCGTVYGGMHLKDLHGSIARLGYCISVPDLYSATWPSLPKKHYIGLINQSKLRSVSCLYNVTSGMSCFVRQHNKSGRWENCYKRAI